MKPLLRILLICLYPLSVFCSEQEIHRKWDRHILICEQKEQRFAIVDAKDQKIIWEWKASGSIREDHVKWFSNPSDARLVYNGTHILATASGGGVALIRISDKKTVFYTYVGGNTHSAELLPDGNIVSASSTGNYLTLIRVDTASAPDQVYKKNIPIDFGHNVVWDRRNQLLWSADRHKILAFSYNFNCNEPDLILKESYDMPGTEAHDLFPDFGRNSLWLSNTEHVYRFDIKDRKLIPAEDIALQAHVKSISSGPRAYPTLIIKPKESWWTDEILDSRGERIFMQSGLRIYKARWMLPVPFSYLPGDQFRICK